MQRKTTPQACKEASTNDSHVEPSAELADHPTLAPRLRRARPQGTLEQPLCSASHLKLFEIQFEKEHAEVSQETFFGSSTSLKFYPQGWSDSHADLYFPLAQRLYLGIGFMYSRMRLKLPSRQSLRSAPTMNMSQP